MQMQEAREALRDLTISDATYAQLKRVGGCLSGASSVVAVGQGAAELRAGTGALQLEVRQQGVNQHPVGIITAGA